MKNETIRFDQNAKGPLRGYRVADMTRLVAGNMLSLQLADFGADVIKVEPPSGDPLRAWLDDGKPLFWKVYGRNKRSVVLDIRSDDGISALRSLLAKMDVFIENFRPGTLEKIGLAPENLLKLNPDLLIVRISGFGQTGPYARQPGFGTLVEAMSGYAARSGYPDQEPLLPPLALADMIAGVYGASAVSMALLARERGDAKGQVIDLSLLESIFSVLGPEITGYAFSQHVKKRVGNASHTASPRNVYKCADGQYLSLSGSIQNIAERIFRAIGRPDMISDPKFATNSARVKNREEVDQILGDWFSKQTGEQALAIMKEAGATVAPVYDISDIASDAHFRQRQVYLPVEDKDYGSLLMHNMVPRLNQTPGVWRRPAPALGEHTEAVLSEFGITMTRDNSHDQKAKG